MAAWRQMNFFTKAHVPPPWVPAALASPSGSPGVAVLAQLPSRDTARQISMPRRVPQERGTHVSSPGQRVGTHTQGPPEPSLVSLRKHRAPTPHARAACGNHLWKGTQQHFIQLHGSSPPSKGPRDRWAPAPGNNS